MGPQVVQEWGRKMTRNGIRFRPGLVPQDVSGCWLRKRRVARAEFGVLLRWRWVCCVGGSGVGCQRRHLAIARAPVSLPGIPCTAATLLAELLAEFLA